MRTTSAVALYGATLLLLAACASDDPPTAESAPGPAADAAPGSTVGATPAPAPEAAPTAPSAAPSVVSPSAAPPVRAGNGLGLSEDEVLAVFADNRLDPDAFEAMELGDGRRVFAASYPATTQRQVLWVAMFGGDDPHTVRVDYFPANAQGGESETVGLALAGLMQALFPDWSEAGAWPEQAGARAWQETAKAAEQGAGEQGGVRVPILEAERDGVWLGALGVPPEVVSYVFTTSQPCRPSVAAASFYQGYADCG